MFFILIVTCTFAMEAEDMKKFAQFKQQYGRNYANPAEEKLRFSIFQKNLKKIEELNSARKKPTDAFFGVGQFTDLLDDEIPRNYALPLEIDDSTEGLKTAVDGVVIDTNPSHLELPEGDDLPKNVAYCSDTVVNNTERIKVNFCGNTYNQMHCGSCYAASQANLAQYTYANQSYVEGEDPVKLNFGIQYYLNQTMNSTKFLNSSNKRCCGGSAAVLYELNPFYFLEEDAPLIDGYNKNDTVLCKPQGILFKPTVQMAVLKYQSFEVTTAGDNAAQVLKLKKILHHYGPVTVAIKTEGNDWSNYKGGIFHALESACQMNISSVPKVSTDHQVDLVGYGKEGDEEYLIIRNSWGNTWGEKGYMKYSTKQLCGIGWDFDKSKGSKYAPASGVIFASSCSLDKNCETCGSNKKCSKCKEGTTMNDYGICITDPIPEEESSSIQESSSNLESSSKQESGFDDSNSTQESSSNVRSSESSTSFHIFIGMILFIVITF